MKKNIQINRSSITAIITLIVYLLGINISFLSVPIQIQAQTPARFNARLTMPVAANSVLIIQNADGQETQKAIVSDVLHSTKFTLESDGSLKQMPLYYPYGNVTSTVNSTINPNNRYYTGQRKVTTDDSLYNYNARYYNPDIGVFTQPDPMEGPNRFAYVNGNPAMASDPSGYMSTDTRGAQFHDPSHGLMLVSSARANRLPEPGNPEVYTGQIWESEKDAAVRDMLAVPAAGITTAIAYGGAVYAVPAAVSAGGACLAALGPCLMGIGDGLLLASGASTVPSFPSPLIAMRGIRGGASELEAASPMYKSLTQMAYENPVSPHLPTLENDIARGVNSFVPNEGMKVRRLADLIIPDSEGRVASLAQRSPAQGKHIFVMTTDGEIIVAKRSGGSALSPHTSLAGGSPVVSAGNIIFSGGRIVAIDAHSGHYRPPISSLSAVWDKIEELGVAMFVPKDAGEATRSIIHHFHH